MIQYISVVSDSGSIPLSKLSRNILISEGLSYFQSIVRSSEKDMTDSTS